MDSQVKCLIAIVLDMTRVLCAVLWLFWSISDIPNSEPNNICLPKTVNAEDGLTCGNVAYELHNYFLQGIVKEYHVLEQQESEKKASDRPVSLNQYYENKNLQLQPAARFTGKTQKQANRNIDLLESNRQVGRTIQNGYEWLYTEFHVQPRFGSEQVVYAIPFASSEMIDATGNNNTYRLPYVPFPSNVIPWNGEAIPDEYDEEFRLNSLHSFCFKDNLKPSLENIAASGFYCTQDRRKIRCAFCNVFYPFNHRGNDAHSIHMRIRPTCPMVNNEGDRAGNQPRKSNG